MILVKSNFQLTLQPTGGTFWKRNISMVRNVQVIVLQPPVILKNNNMQNNPKTPKNVYYIDQVELSGDNVAVDYTLNDNWLFINLSFSELKQFALNRSINDYIFDYMHGEHVQDAGSFDIDTFMSENLDAVIKVYLQANPLESVNVQMEALKANINKRKLSTINA